MPSRRPEPPTKEGYCRRCHNVEASITVRTEALCKDCFAKYVQTKIVKRMESFKVRYTDVTEERKLLLAFTPDPCSVALLHILSQQLKNQTAKTGRTGFAICVLHITDDTIPQSQASELLDVLKVRYPEHDYVSIAFSTADASKQLPEVLAMTLDPDLSPEERLKQLLKTPVSLTSREDLKQILKRNIIVQHAKDKACEAVLWTESTSKLAAKALAETAKGRGHSLPWIFADGDSPHDIPCYHPLRDLLSKELEAYVAFLEPPIEQRLLQAEISPSVSTKNTTIDDLMRQYFESVEQEYPSIVANVVRTTGKLHAGPLSAVEQQCELCNLPLEGNAPAMSRLCYGCVRLFPSSAD